MNKEKAQQIYKIIMLILITALVTMILTTVFVYKKLTGTINISNIIASGDNSGLELTLSRLRTMIEKEYIGEINDEAMIESAIKGYVAGLGDKYTEYYTPEEMSEQLDEAYGNYVGIGIYMLIDNQAGQIIVVKPMENSPAEKAGIQTGDIITKVDGEDVTVENVSGMSNKIKGEEGTTVNIEILRGEKKITLKVERKRIVVSHINSNMIDKEIGYINIIDFDGGTAVEFEKKYNELVKKGMKSLIIDIRNNGGGIVDEAIEILDLLLPSDITLLITENKNKQEEITKSKNEQKITMPVVLLTNEYSASASEILAGALKDNNRAKLVGVKTYGKGVIQTLHTLTDGSGLKITSEEYYTPKHNKINNVGIEPDYNVVLSEDVEELNDSNDNQFKKAIELLK